MKNTLKTDKKEAAGSTEGRKKPSAANKSTGQRTARKGLHAPAWMGDARTRKIAGIALVFLAFFFFVASVSFIFSGHEDLRLMNPGSAADTEGIPDAYSNLLGLIGAHAGYLLVHKGFGVGSLFVPFLLFLYGVKVWLRKTLLPLAKTTRLSLLGLLYAPLAIAFFFYSGNREDGIVLSCNDHLVGHGGLFMLDFFTFNLGALGTFLVLAFIAGATIVFNFNPLLEQLAPLNAIGRFIRRLGAPKKHHGADETSAKPSATDAPSERNKSSNDVEVNAPESDESNAADDVINEFIQPEQAAVTIALDGEPEDLDEDTFETANTNALSPSIDPQSESTDDDADLEIEVLSDENSLSEDEIDDRVQEFGLYDPTLDLARYELPNIDLLEPHGSGVVEINKEELEANKNRIVETLNNYNIEISKIKATVGPTVTLYEIVPAPGVRISKIKNLEDDIALSLAALGIRIIAPIPGKGTIGIEVPNSNPNVVAMRSLIASDKFQNSDMELPIAIGRTISNETFTFDLAKMPHLLMAGATGQGKSVGLNAMLVSLLYKKHPSQLKFVLVDPKKVELTLFNKIERHFLAMLPDEEEPIITDTSKVVKTLNSLCVEMDDRYELLKTAHCRNIKEYNKKFVQRKLNPDKGHRYLPYIVLVVDEFADLIMTAGKEVETPIARLAQLARAIGIHLIIATQRPSVNIITGTIKANFPARIAFRVTSKIDSRTILDAGGADQLIGRGDMLFSTGNDLIRIQCGFVDTPEVEEITDFIGSQQGYPRAYELPEVAEEGGSEFGTFDDEDRDELFEEAAKVIVMHQQGSTSLLQRKLKLGYNRAGRLIDQLEAAGVIGPFEGSKARKVLIPDEASLEQLLHRPS